MKKLILLLYILLAWWSFFPEKNMIVAPHVSKAMNETSKSFTRETMMCLEYEEFLGDVYVYNYYIPRILKSTNNTVKSVKCARETIPYHNHPSFNIDKSPLLQKYYKKATGDSLTSKDQMLYMSYPDMRFMLASGYQYNVVGANGKWTWWESTEVVQAVLSNKLLLKPVR